MSSLKVRIKACTPVKIWEGLGKVKGLSNRLYEIYLIKTAPSRHRKALKRVRKKEKVKVAFFLIHDSVWKYDQLYELMRMDSRFELIVIVCPYISYGDDNMRYEMQKSYTTFQTKGYNVIKALDLETEQWLDVKKQIAPDIVFFTNPHKLTKKEYYISNYSNYLTCYSPYNFGNSHLYMEMHNQFFHNSLWKLYSETDFHKGLSIKYADNKGVNVITTGFCGTDVFLNKDYHADDVWKQKDKKIKRIIWAPHHTIDDDINFLSYSAFLLYAEFMKELLEDYKGIIQIAFKPHPLLRNKLYVHKDWGKEKTDFYYDIWRTSENGQLNEGEYIDLFLTSDAMIHDSGSFLTEYLYLNKPVLHTNRDEKIKNRMNLFGIESFNMHYHAKNQNDILIFIQGLLNGIDEKFSQRKTFLKERLLPPNRKTASENIYNEIVSKVFE